MKNIKYVLVFLINFFVLCKSTKAQYFITYPKWYPETKFKHLFIIATDSSTQYAKEVMAIVKKNWTLCPVKFFPKYLSASKQYALETKGNLFMEADDDSKSTTFNRDFSNGGGTRSTMVYNNYFHITLWTVNENSDSIKYIKNNKIVIASAELFNRTIGQGTLAAFSKFDFTAENFYQDYCNGRLGNIKNMIQFFNKELPQNNAVKFLKDQPPSPEINNLKTDTLFVPNYWYGGKGTMLADEEEESKYIRLNRKYIESMIGSYAYKIKLIPLEEWNSKILTATKDFYYLNYIQSSADKVVSVVNGYTGAVVYSEITRKSYRIKDKDLKRIEEAIK